MPASEQHRHRHILADDQTEKGQGPVFKRGRHPDPSENAALREDQDLQATGATVGGAQDPGGGDQGSVDRHQRDAVSAEHRERSHAGPARNARPEVAQRTGSPGAEREESADVPENVRRSAGRVRFAVEDL